MKRKTYRANELKAGKTVFIVTCAMLDHAGRLRYAVSEHLIGSKSEPQPEPGQIHPYRMHPQVAQYAATRTDLYRSHRAALHEAARRQAHADRQISSRSA